MEGWQPRAPFRWPEWMVFLGALGVLVSVAVPSYLRLSDPQRVDAFTASAVDLLERVHAGGGGLMEPRDRPVDARRSPPVVARSIPAEAMEEFLSLYDRTGQRPRSDEALIVLEPAGLAEARCARDGRIHVIPAEPEEDGRVASVTVLVTDRDRRAGPAGDGLLAVYKIRTDR